MRTETIALLENGTRTGAEIGHKSVALNRRFAAYPFNGPTWLLPSASCSGSILDISAPNRPTEEEHDKA